MPNTGKTGLLGSPEYRAYVTLKSAAKKAFLLYQNTHDALDDTVSIGDGFQDLLFEVEARYGEWEAARKAKERAYQALLSNVLKPLATR